MGIRYIRPDSRALQYFIVNTIYSWPVTLVWTDQEEVLFAMICITLH